MTTLAINAPVFPSLLRGDMRLAGGLSPYEFVHSHSFEDGLSKITLDNAYRKINSLKSRGENWDGRGSAAPDVDSMVQARVILSRMFEASEDQWIEPFLSSSEDGTVTMEWWSPTRKLTIYASAEDPFFIKVWGADIENEMEDGLVSEHDLFSLWGWLSP